MLKELEGKPKSWKFGLVVVGLFSLVGASALVGGLRMWSSPVTPQLLAEAFLLQQCHAVEDKSLCEVRLLLVGAPTLMCTHSAADGTIEEVECCDGVQNNVDVTASNSDECNVQCVDQFYANWHLDAKPWEATVYGSFEDGQCTCMDLMCLETEK